MAAAIYQDNNSYVGTGVLTHQEFDDFQNNHAGLLWLDGQRWAALRFGSTVIIDNCNFSAAIRQAKAGAILFRAGREKSASRARSFNNQLEPIQKAVRSLSTTW